MKREVEREKELPAFSLTVGELELLWSRITALFDDPGDAHAWFTIRLPSERLEFANIEELKQYAHLPARITNFTLSLSQGGRSVTLRSGRLLTKAEVSASSETEAWCAGAIDTVFSFTQSHKLWYNWFVSAPIGWVLLLPIVVAAILCLLCVTPAEASCDSPTWLDQYHSLRSRFGDECPEADMTKPMFTRVGTLACETLNGYQLAYNARARSWTYSPTAGVRPSSADFPKLKIGTRPGTPTPPDYFGCTIHEDGVPISTVDKRTRSGSIYHTNLGWLSPADLRNSR